VMYRGTMASTNYGQVAQLEKKCQSFSNVHAQKNVIPQYYKPYS